MKDLVYPLRVLHGKIHEWFINIWPLYYERLRNPKAVYLVFTPEHENLGDHAIAQAETVWLKELRIPYIEVTGKRLEELKRRKCLHIMNGRSILVHGGGYLGTIWMSSELLLRDVISQNQKSPIIILPNTIYYENTCEGLAELEKSKEIYCNHPSLKIYAREQYSFIEMKTVYRDVALVPDMVFRLNKCENTNHRSGGILCVRNDRERTRTTETDLIIRKQLEGLFGDHIRSLDMVASHAIPVSERDAELEKQFDAFRHAELVVTDRLHGMIFCAITGTPCIVIDSKSPKVRGCYEWIKDLPYIQFCDDPLKIVEIYHAIPKQEWVYDNSKLLPLYEPLERDLLAAVMRTF